MWQINGIFINEKAVAGKIYSRFAWNYLCIYRHFFLSFFFFFLKTDLLSFERANRNERFILAWPNKQNKICKNETLL